MIADFRYDPLPAEGVIAVELHRNVAGTDSAILVIPADVRRALRNQCPSPGEIMSLPSALGAGVFVAAQTSRSLRISGDRQAWPEEWGALLPRRPAARHH